MNMSSLQGKRKEVGSKPQSTGASVGAATPFAAPVQETEIVDAMEKMTLGHEFEAILDLVQELVERLNYLAVRVEEVSSNVMEAPVDP